jgi:RNA polymerase sigma-70 factor (ECF subfamily)
MSNRNQGDDVIGQLSALRRYARALTRDETHADDLVHDALVRAFERRSTFRRGGGDLRTWLFSILHNTFIDGRRRQAAELRRHAEVSRLTDRVIEPPQESSVRLDQIRQAFNALPEEQRAALHLVAVEGLPYEKAATSLNIPVGTLMSRLGRARAALRAYEDTRPTDRPQLAAPDPSWSRPNLRVVGGKND